MFLWWMTALVAGIGALGGLINAYLTDNGFVLPMWSTTIEQQRVLRPGVLGNTLVGAAAAFLTWGLYGPYANAGLGGATAPSGNSVSLSTLVGTFLAGVGGARYLSTVVDKRLLSATAVTAAVAPSDAAAAVKIARSTPATALEVAKRALSAA